MKPRLTYSAVFGLPGLSLSDRSTHLSREQIDAILNLLRELGEVA